MKAGSAELVVILDRSGSMDAVRSDVEGGFNQFIRKQQEVPGECDVTLVQFDYDDSTQRANIDQVYAGKPLRDVPPLRLEPRGWTPLNDAVGVTIKKTGERLKALVEDQRPERVMVVIITDGLENRSKEFTRDAVRRMIEHQRTQYKWEFVYLGANVDAFAEARELGIPVSAAAGYSHDSAGVAAAFGAVSDSAKDYRVAGASPDFSPEERERMKPGTAKK